MADNYTVNSVASIIIISIGAPPAPNLSKLMVFILTQVGAVEVLELAALPHVAVGALAVVEDRVGDLDGEARGAVQAVPSDGRESKKES